MLPFNSSERSLGLLLRSSLVSWLPFADSTSIWLLLLVLSSVSWLRATFSSFSSGMPVTSIAVKLFPCRLSFSTLSHAPRCISEIMLPLRSMFTRSFWFERSMDEI